MKRKEREYILRVLTEKLKRVRLNEIVSRENEKYLVIADPLSINDDTNENEAPSEYYVTDKCTGEYIKVDCLDKNNNLAYCDDEDITICSEDGDVPSVVKEMVENLAGEYFSDNYDDSLEEIYEYDDGSKISTFYCYHCGNDMTESFEYRRISRCNCCKLWNRNAG